MPVLTPLGIGKHHDHLEVAVAAMHAVIDHEAADSMAPEPRPADTVGPAVAVFRCG
ncbi:hypothetical protein [Nocardia anaemiae]|uniref:hypothetical protein n=1 Tax=Nocardia anaemiae TaxID=263910 RepID=UPI0012F4CAA7|nr:hypothetical protein [Nocardia anaemiae]